MKDKLSSILNILLIVLMVLSALLGILFYTGTSQFVGEPSFAEQMDMLGSRLDNFLNWAILLTLATAVAAVLFPAIKLVTDPKSSMKSIYMIVGFALVALLAYGVASDQIPTFHGYEKFFYDDITMDPNKFAKYVDTGLWGMYILAGLSLLSILYYEVAKWFK